jgi:tetratricopeptide (TPR) repeat protein
MQQAGASTAAFSPDGKTLAVGTLAFPRGAQLWDVASGKPLGGPLPTPRVHCVAFSPDGKTVLTAGFGKPTDQGEIQGEARLWEVATQRPIGKALLHGGPIYSAAWSRDGRTIVTGSVDTTARLWNARTGQPIGKALKHRNTVIAVAFAPDDKTALTGSADGTARLWDAATGEPIGEPLRHRGPVVAVAFSPDGRTVLTGSEDRTARLWDASTGKPVGEPLRHGGSLGPKSVAFSPDGHVLLTGSQDGTARLWEASTGLPVGVPWHHQGGITAVAFSPDGRLAVTAGGDGKAQVRKVPPLVKGLVSLVALWPEVITGRRLDPDRVVRLLASDEWARTARRLDAAGGIAAPPFDALAWHRREARAREAAGQWFPAAWHLGRLIDSVPDPLPFYSRRGRANLEMGQMERAVADYSRAVERRKDSAPAWFDRGHAYLIGREWKKAVEDLRRAIELDPNFAPAWHHRGYARAALGQWKPAAEDLAEAVKRPGVPAEALSHQALLCLRFQDAEGYRKACKLLLQHFLPRTGGNTPNTPAGSSRFPVMYLMTSSGPKMDLDAFALAAWTCAVGPNAGVDPRKATQWYSFANDESAKPYAFHRAAGAVLYRAGDFEAAIRKLHLALDAAHRVGQEGTPTVWLFLAMAEQRLKHPDKAREWLDKARAWSAAARKPMPGPDGPDGTSWDHIPWPERLALELLQAEAEKLIHGDAPKP